MRILKENYWKDVFDVDVTPTQEQILDAWDGFVQFCDYGRDGDKFIVSTTDDTLEFDSLDDMIDSMKYDIDQWIEHDKDYDDSSDWDSSYRSFKESKSINEASEAQPLLIKTGLHDRKAFEILESVIGQLSDGIWENSPAMNKYWKYMDISGDQNEILIKIDNTDWNSGFRGKTADWIATWVANKVKQIVKTEEEDGNNAIKWDRSNTEIVDYLDRGSGVTVRDAYRVYDKLKGRKDYIKESMMKNTRTLLKENKNSLKEAEVDIEHNPKDRAEATLMSLGTEMKKAALLRASLVKEYQYNIEDDTKMNRIADFASILDAAIQGAFDKIDEMKAQGKSDDNKTQTNEACGNKKAKKKLKEEDELEPVVDEEVIEVSSDIYDSLFNEDSEVQIDIEEVEAPSLVDNEITFNYKGEDYVLTVEKVEEEDDFEEIEDETLTDTFESLYR